MNCVVWVLLCAEIQSRPLPVGFYGAAARFSSPSHAAMGALVFQVSPRHASGSLEENPRRGLLSHDRKPACSCLMHGHRFITVSSSIWTRANCAEISLEWKRLPAPFQETTALLCVCVLRWSNTRQLATILWLFLRQRSCRFASLMCPLGFFPPSGVRIWNVPSFALKIGISRFLL